MDSPLQKDQDKPAWCRRYRLSSLWQSSGGGIFFRAWLRRRDRRAFSTVVVFKRTSIFSPIKAFFVLFEFSIRAKKIYQAYKIQQPVFLLWNLFTHFPSLLRKIALLFTFDKCPAKKNKEA